MDFMDGRCWIMLRARNISFCFGELIRDSYSPVARFLSMQGDDLIEGFVAMNIYSWRLTNQRSCHFLLSTD